MRCRLYRSIQSVFQSTPSVWRETSAIFCCGVHNTFQSTPSVWRETALVVTSGFGDDISIHSLRVEGDSDEVGLYFTIPVFQSTPSVWRETVLGWFLIKEKNISIHSLRVEGDSAYISISKKYLISIHSLRVEGDKIIDGYKNVDRLFQSTPSVWRETHRAQTQHQLTYFNPLPPCGGRLVACGNMFTRMVFQSTPSVWRETVKSYCTRV